MIKSLRTYIRFYKLISFNMVEKIIDVDKIHEERKYKDTDNLLESIGVNNKDAQVFKLQTKTTTYGNRIKISSLVNPGCEVFIGKIITIGGWTRSIRAQGGGEFLFVELNDGTTMKNLQIVIDKTMPEFTAISNQGVGACLKLTGEVVKSQGNKQPIEMLINSPEVHVAKLIGESNPSEYVLHKSRPTLEYLRDIAHLRPKNKRYICSCKNKKLTCIFYSSILPAKRIYVCSYSNCYCIRL